MLSPSAAFTSPVAVAEQPSTEASPPTAAPPVEKPSGGAASCRKTRAAPKQRNPISRPQKPTQPKGRLATRRAAAAATSQARKRALEKKGGKRKRHAEKASAMRAAKEQKHRAQLLLPCFSQRAAAHQAP